jgi:hypothetical protein
LKNLIFSQTNDKFDENSTWRTLKYPKHEIQNKKLKSLSKIKKLGSFFDFHTKRPKLQNREMQLVAIIHGFGGWNFAGDITLNHINDFLLIKLDLSPSKHPTIYIYCRMKIRNHDGKFDEFLFQEPSTKIYFKKTGELE